ncbi:MAG TPA: efflux RND transporter periplasmic adaptor subunit [Steroidobacteraceae bacterium]|nr:efflux RND transporter periplasmic adaptor subunit [Steroidobacteraceae bacterium]
MSETQEANPPAAPRHHWARWIVGAVGALLLVFVLIHIFERKKAPRGAAPQVVKVAKAALGSMPETLAELGTVTPDATVTVLPQLSGYLTAVGYKEGQDVKKGQFLAQIDPRQYEIDLRQSQAALLKDQATLAQARSDLARYHELRAQKAIAEQTVTDQEFIVQQDEAQVKSDEANIAQYKLDLIYCHITAPVAGRVGLRLIDPGNYVTASSSPGIVVITTMKPTTVEFTVAQNDLGKVIQRINSGAQLPVTAYNSDNSAQIATGTLYALSNQMATSTGTVTLRARFANDDEALFPSEFVNIKILVDTLQQAVIVPTPAVLSGAPGDYVYLVNGTNDTVSVRKVTLGPSDGRNTAILSGLAVGDTVVIDGTDRLSDGATISIAAPTPPAAAGAATGASAAGTPTPGSPPGSKARKRPSASAQGSSSSN